MTRHIFPYLEDLEFDPNLIFQLSRSFVGPKEQGVRRGTDTRVRARALVEMPADWPTSKIVVSGVLAVLGGYTDVICVIRYTAFPATQTGNVIFVGSALHHLWFPKHPLMSREKGMEEGTVWFRICVILVSIFGAYAFCAFQHFYPKKTTASAAAPVLALLVASADVVPWLAGVSNMGQDGPVRWCVMPLAFAFGATHFICSPTSENSRLKAVTFAATGHMHKLMKAMWKTTVGSPPKASDRPSIVQSFVVVMGMVSGAVLGTAAMHLCPVKGGEGLFVPCALALFACLFVHDAVLEPPGGWPEALVKPLAPAGEGSTSTA